MGEPGTEQRHHRRKYPQRQPEHEQAGHHPQLGQAEGPHIQDHLGEGRGDEHQGENQQKQAEKPGGQGCFPIFPHQNVGNAHHAEIQDHEDGHFEEAPAGIVRCREIFWQNASESAEKVGGLAQKIEKIHRRNDSQEAVDPGGGDVPLPDLPGGPWAVGPEAHRLGVGQNEHDETPEQAGDKLGIFGDMLREAG